jgi:tetratricopeptide (TPR) repeat protein
MRRGARWLVLPCLLAALLPPLAALPQTSEQVAKETAKDAPIDLEKLHRERTARAAIYPMRKRISRYLEAAAKAVDAGKSEEGEALLQKLDTKRLNPLERALVFRLQAYLAYFAGNYAAAREHFEKVLAEEILPVRDDNRIRFNIAQLHASNQQWKEAIAALDRWERYVEEPDPLALYLRGVAHHQLGDVDAAVAHTQKAVDLAREPQESWLNLLSALYIMKEDYPNATRVLEQLVVRNPAKQQYWVRLALIYGAQEKYPQSLAVQNLAYRQGLLAEDKELRRLARSSLHQDIPYPAAEILERGLAAGTIERDTAALELLANSWIAAREYERSLPALEGAAKLSPDGNLYVRLGQVYMQREQWKEATEMLRQAIAKGGLRDLGNAQLLLGIGLYNDQRMEQARSAFAQARQHESTRAAAERWITHLDGDSGAG